MSVFRYIKDEKTDKAVTLLRILSLSTYFHFRTLTLIRFCCRDILQLKSLFALYRRLKRRRKWFGRNQEVHRLSKIEQDEYEDVIIAGRSMKSEKALHSCYPDTVLLYSEVNPELFDDLLLHTD